MNWLAVSPEARFQALVTLIGGVIVILAAVGGLVWRAGRWIRRQEDATRANTQALVGTDHTPGLIDTVADMKQSLDELRREIRGRRR